MIFTHERKTPNGTRFSALQATEQLWQPMQRLRSITMAYLFFPVSLFFIFYRQTVYFFKKVLSIGGFTYISKKKALFAGPFFLKKGFFCSNLKFLLRSGEEISD
jgi:hypothetical protein